MKIIITSLLCIVLLNGCKKEEKTVPVRKEITIRMYSEPVTFPVKHSRWWSRFMNNHAVWVSDKNKLFPGVSHSIKWDIYIPKDSFYIMKTCTDNQSTILIDSDTVQKAIDTFWIPKTDTIKLKKGFHILNAHLINFGGPAGMGILLTSTDGSIVLNTRDRIFKDSTVTVTE
jgi:hypothetical protein